MFTANDANNVFIVILLVLIIGLGAFFLLKRLYFIWTKRVLDRLVFKRSFSEEVAPCGKELFLIETVYNPTNLPIFGVTVEEYIYNDLELMEFIHNDKLMMQYYPSKFRIILPRMQIKRSNPVKCRKRGHYTLKSAELTCYKHRIITESVAEIFVYPEPSEIKLSLFSANDREGESDSRLPLIADPFSFGGIRNYRSGDPFSAINFKATAKTPVFTANDIKVNTKDFISDRKTLVLINFSFPEINTIHNEKYVSLCEEALSGAAYILTESISNGYRAGFAANCKYENSLSLIYPTYSSRESYFELMRSLSAVRIEPGVAFGRILDRYLKENIHGTQIYIFTIERNDGINRAVASFESKDNYVRVLIPRIKDKKDPLIVSEYEIEEWEE